MIDKWLIRKTPARTTSKPNSPLGVAVQLGEHRVVAVLKHQVELPFAAEHLDQVHQVAVFELLQRRGEIESKKKTKTKTKTHARM